MSQYKEVDEQVRKIFATGATEESVKVKLRESGYNEEDISSIIMDAKSVANSTPPTISTPPQTPQTETKKMSEGLKITIIVLFALAVAAGLFFTY